MAPEDRKTLYWTAGATLGLIVLVIAAGMFLGWFDAGTAAKP